MLDKLKLPTTYVAMTPDVVMSDLLKTSRSSEIFSITGLPDVTLGPPAKRRMEPASSSGGQGLDIFRPDTMETDEIEAENLPCWMLDSNYNGMVFWRPRFLPENRGMGQPAKIAQRPIQQQRLETPCGNGQRAFVWAKGRIAVKAIDERGNELMVVKSAEEVANAGRQAGAAAERHAEVESPIINSPFLEPQCHWQINERGRRLRRTDGAGPVISIACRNMPGVAGKAKALRICSRTRRARRLNLKSSMKFARE